jgi:multidrug resistance efflux pump
MSNKSQFPIIDAEFAALRVQMTQLDIPGMRTRLDKARAELEAFTAAHAHNRTLEGKLLAMQSALDNLVGDLKSAEGDAKRINNEIDRLVMLLTAEDRAMVAQQSIDATKPLVDAARAAVEAVRAAKAEIQTLMDAEAKALEAAKSQAGGALLEQIKQGKPGKLQSVSRERLDTLLLAQQAADAELESAQIELDTHTADLREARGQLADAQADTSNRTLYLTTREYAKALRDARATAQACGRYFDAPDVDLLIRQLDHAAMEGDK